MASTLAITFTALVSFGVPVGVFLYLLIAKRRCLPAFAVGALTFLVFQVLTRIPLLTWLATQSWFVAFQVANPVAYLLILAFTAGLFEEGGRLITMGLLLKKRRTWSDGLAFGLGHGGFEAFVLVGISAVVLLFSSNAPLAGTSAWAIAAGGFERICAMSIQVGLSMLVMKCVKDKKPLYFLLALLAHTLVDAVAVLAQYLGAGLWVIEGIMAIFAAIALLYTFMVRPKWENGGNHNEAQQTA